MRFSILHISDLHRDLSDELDNPVLLESLSRDFARYSDQDPKIMRPSLCILSGDLVYGVKPEAADAAKELERQYAQVEAFLVGLADKFFGGDRSRIVILPGNHDVCYEDVIGSAARIDIPADLGKRAELGAELFKPNSLLRWSWSELCFFRITDVERYRNRLRHFAITYNRFYQGQRTFSLAPEEQYGIFDFPDLGFCVVALSSCYNNDPLRRAGAFHPNAVVEACEALRDPSRIGWLIAGAWHHNLFGGPAQDDYLDVEVMQLLIDAGVSLGFHGHQHMAECVDERYRIGPSARKMTIISASTLCAGPLYLKPGVPRSYNIVELDTDNWTGRVHQRQMVNKLFNLPIWGPGHFSATNSTFIDLKLSQPLLTRPAQLDTQLVLERGDKFIGFHQWREAVDVLEELHHVPLARPLLVKALDELGDARRTIDILWPPLTSAETVIVGGAILEGGTREEADRFMQLETISDSADASVREISRRIRERMLR